LYKKKNVSHTHIRGPDSVGQGQKRLALMTQPVGDMVRKALGGVAGYLPGTALAASGVRIVPVGPMPQALFCLSRFNRHG
jgi:hypothetical protein